MTEPRRPRGRPPRAVNGSGRRSRSNSIYDYGGPSTSDDGPGFWPIGSRTRSRSRSRVPSPLPSLSPSPSPPPPRARRGRPPAVSRSSTPAPARRGRPPAVNKSTDTKISRAKTPEAPPVKRGPGRPPSKGAIKVTDRNTSSATNNNECVTFAVMESLRERYKEMLNEERKKTAIEKEKVKKEELLRVMCEKKLAKAEKKLLIADKKVVAVEAERNNEVAAKNSAIQKMLKQSKECLKMREELKRMERENVQQQKDLDEAHKFGENQVLRREKIEEENAKLKADNHKLNELLKKQEPTNLRSQITTNEVVCRVCRGSHSSKDCPLSPPQRAQLFKLLGRCVICLTEHKIGHCLRDNKTCARCKDTSHDALLCQEMHAWNGDAAAEVTCRTAPSPIESSSSGRGSLVVVKEEPPSVGYLLRRTKQEPHF